MTGPLRSDERNTATSRSLPPGDLRFLRVLGALVPGAERDSWVQGWRAELWHVRFGQHAPIRAAVYVDLSMGIALDALWLRRESWRRRHGGTAALCLALLGLLCVVAALMGADLVATQEGSWAGLRTLLLHSAFATPLIALVGSITGWRYTESSAPRNAVASVRRTLFLGAKSSLVFVLAALLSADVCLPLHLHFRGMSDVLQQLFFVLLALVGLRWSFADQEARCKDCLRALASPERVGRPSHNLLEWAGTEQVCIHGHGALNSPEMVSSWANHSRWVDSPAHWESTASAS